MSTHNICFCDEIRKISAFLGLQKRLICCYEFPLKYNTSFNPQIPTAKYQQILFRGELKYRRIPGVLLVHNTPPQPRV